MQEVWHKLSRDESIPDTRHLMSRTSEANMPIMITVEAIMNAAS